MKGHTTKSIEHNGERSRSESAWTWTCQCGAQESASSRAEALRERRHHLARYRTPEPLSEAQERALRALESGSRYLDDKASKATVAALQKRELIRTVAGQDDVFEITSKGKIALEDHEAAQAWRSED